MLLSFEFYLNFKFSIKMSVYRLTVAPRINFELRRAPQDATFEQLNPT